MNNQFSTQYIGDGLYAEFDGYHIVLKANSPTAPTDTVYLDSGTLSAFLAYVQRLKDAGAL